MSGARCHFQKVVKKKKKKAKVSSAIGPPKNKISPKILQMLFLKTFLLSGSISFTFMGILVQVI